MWSVPDWRTDEMYTLLDNREKGIYRELMDECWVSGGISSDMEVLARSVREPLDYFLKVWVKISPKFRALRSGLLTSKRLQQDRRRIDRVRLQRHNKAITAAFQRWNKVKADKELHAQSMLGASQTQTQTQRIHKEGEKKTSPSERQKKGPTDPPREFEITDDLWEWAATEQLTNVVVQVQTAKMLDWFRGKGQRRTDWNATWRNWMRTYKEREGNNGHRRQEKSKADITRESCERVLALTDPEDRGGGERGD